MRQSKRISAKKIDYRTEENSDGEKDFEDSGSEASVHENDEDEDDDAESVASSGDDFVQTKHVKKKMPSSKQPSRPKIPFKALKKAMLSNNTQSTSNTDPDMEETNFSIKDLTEQEKLLPAFLNLSESDSDSDSDNDKPEKCPAQPLEYKSFFEKEIEQCAGPSGYSKDSDLADKIPVNQMERLSDSDSDTEMKMDLSANNVEIIKKNQAQFNNIEEQNLKFNEIKKSLEVYNRRHSEVKDSDFDVGSLLAMGEAKKIKKTKVKVSKKPNLSDSDDEDLEEVQESNTRANIPKGGIQVVLDVPTQTKKTKKAFDIEMILKRRINRVKKEYQVYMHQVHVLCWIAHGNYLNKIINNMDIMAAALSLIPSEHCYPSNRINIKYLEQISKWYAEMLNVIEDKTKFKFKSNRLPIDVSLLQQIGKKTFSSKKSKVLVFISLLRALGIKCRLVLSFRVVPLRPSVNELCSLSTKKSNAKTVESKHFKSSKVTVKDPKKVNESTLQSSHRKISKESGDKIPQLDGADDLNFKNGRGHNTRSKKLSLMKKTMVTTTSQVKEFPNKSCDPELSYWDKITQGTIEKDEKRISHRDLSKSSSTSPQKSTNNQSTSMKSPASEKSLLNNKPTPSAVLKNQPKKKEKLVKNTNGSINVQKSDPKANTSNQSSKIIESTKLPLKRKSTNPINLQTKKIKKTEEALSNTQNKSSSTLKSKKTSEYFENQNNTTLKTKAKEAPNMTPNPKKLTTRKTKPKDQGTSSQYFKNSEENSRIGKSNKSLAGSQSKASGSKIANDRKRKDSNGDSDSDFLPASKKNIRKNPASKIDRRVLSTDDEHSVDEKKKDGVNVWCEVYVEEEEQWISVDVIKGQVHCVSQIYNRANHPVAYVVTWDTNNHVKDVTKRYVPHWNTTTRKLRTNSQWYDSAVRPWMAPPHLRDQREDEQLEKLELDAPLPQSISEFKNHPLYALKRHLLKFEVIYPPDALTLGFVRNEAVYARECVHTCRSRETWVKEAKVVKPGETPYKIVKARPKYDRSSGQVITDIPLEIFGPWQVDDYVPPKAEDGKVPRNPYGNVELFKPCMLPEGTVHLTLPGLNRVAKKLGIDCAPAMVGFDYHSGGSHPVYDGFVVCKEFEDTIIIAWEQEQEEAEKRAREKIDKRVYGNWRRIIRGLFIRERLQAKYDFQLDAENVATDNTKQTKKSKKK